MGLNLEKILKKKLNENDRVIFKTGFQRKFLLTVKKNSILTWKELGVLANINDNTLRRDCVYEKYSMSAGTINKLIQFLHPKVNISNWIVEIKPKNWGQKKGGLKALAIVAGRKGAQVRKNRLKRERIKHIKTKYKIFEKEAINEFPTLDINKIELSKNDLKKGLKLPNKLIPHLAEEIGIHIGDGYLGRKNRFRLAGDKLEEKLYFDQYIIPLYKKVYNIELKGFIEGSVYGIDVYSKGLFDFKHHIIGLPAGSKARTIYIPDIIMKSNNKEIIQSCIRGIFDTDSTLYFIRGNYPLIRCNMASKKLVRQLKELLTKIGFIVSTSKYHEYYVLSLYGRENLNHWVKAVGFNNPKHSTKVNLWKKYGYCPPNTTIRQRIKVLKDGLEAGQWSS